MYPKLFHETFSLGKLRDEVFVCMPFEGSSFDNKFKLMKELENVLGLKFTRADRDLAGGDITQKIYDGITNSKIILFDLSDNESECPYNRYVNPNVMYELGYASSIRAPQSIVIIRDKKSKGIIPFVIKDFHINSHKNPLDKDELKLIISNTLDNKRFYSDNLIKIAKDSMSEDLLNYMIESSKVHKGHHFGFPLEELPKVSFEQKMNMWRLQDLHIYYFAIERHDNIISYAHHLTDFGKEFMKHLGLDITEIE